jgi:excinuclease ABC subunit C
VSVHRPNDVPRAPGVYEFSDPAGRTLYVGKAKDLAARISQYFPGRDTDLHPRTRRMLHNATTLRWIVCASETEALVLEREWVHQKQPPYNVRLRAGGGYAGIHVTDEAVPRLTTWRGRRPRNGKTFGPYPGVRAVDLLDALMLLHGVRTCDDATYRKAGKDRRACLLGETGKCLAPCVGKIGVDEHRDAADALVSHLEHPDHDLGERLRADMAEFSQAGNFEAAARRRDQLAALGLIPRRQRVATDGTDVDAVAVERSGERLAAVRVRVREGTVREVDEYIAGDDPGSSDTEILEAVLDQLAQLDVPSTGAGTPVTAVAGKGSRVARGEHERAVLAFAAAQATEALGRAILSGGDDASRDEESRRLGEHLGLPARPRRIECTDISHTGGKHTVGAVVVLLDGEVRPDLHRRLHFGDGNVGGDDYAATEELVRRRLLPNGMGQPELPDVLIIDGGPGQVAAAAKGRDRAATERTTDWDPASVRIVGIAKRFEELWPEGATVPLRLPAREPALLLVQRARDEAHRYSLSGNRRRREREALRSGLDDVAGLGPARKRALLDRFGTLDAVMSAPVEEIAAVKGIGPVLAARIRDTLGTPNP